MVLEASGDPYSYYARASANTGLPTVLGWANLAEDRAARLWIRAISEIRGQKQGAVWDKK